MKRFRCIASFVLVMVSMHTTHAQSETLSLDQCYQLAKGNYPIIQKLDLIRRSSDFEVENVNKRYLPQVSFSGQATYQSQTINFSEAVPLLQGMNLPTLSKDQYKVQGEISQLVFDGGNARNQKALIKANAAVQLQNTESILYGVRQRINSIYFSILLADAQLKQNQLNRANLQTQLEKMEAALINGVAFRSAAEELKAEIVNVEMIAVEYRSNRTACLRMLSLFIGKELDASVQLEQPQGTDRSEAVNRPELQTFSYQRAVYDVQEKQLRSEYLPQVNVFLQGAYGRPTLNIIENKFAPWYITGLRFNWSLGSLYTMSNKRGVLNLYRQSAEADRQAFLLNTKVDLGQQDEQVKKFSELVARDEEVIELRASVTKSADAQLANGIITVHEYIQKLNAEHLARENQLLHKIQLLQAQYNLSFIAGN